MVEFLAGTLRRVADKKHCWVKSGTMVGTSEDNIAWESQNSEKGFVKVNLLLIIKSRYKIGFMENHHQHHKKNNINIIIPPPSREQDFTIIRKQK